MVEHIVEHLPSRLVVPAHHAHHPIPTHAVDLGYRLVPLVRDFPQAVLHAPFSSAVQRILAPSVVRCCVPFVLCFDGIRGGAATGRDPFVARRGIHLLSPDGAAGRDGYRPGGIAGPALDAGEDYGSIVSYVARRASSQYGRPFADSILVRYGRVLADPGDLYGYHYFEGYIRLLPIGLG